MAWEPNKTENRLELEDLEMLHWRFVVDLDDVDN